MIIPCDFSIYDTTTSILDIESLCKLLQRLQVSRKIKNYKKFLNVRDRSYVPILILEIVEPIFNSNNIILVIVTII